VAPVREDRASIFYEVPVPRWRIVDAIMASTGSGPQDEVVAPRENEDGEPAGPPSISSLSADSAPAL